MDETKEKKIGVPERERGRYTGMYKMRTTK